MDATVMVKWAKQGQRIRAIQDDDGETNIKRAAEKYGLSYSTYHYARSGKRIGVEFLVTLFEKENISADFVMLGVGNPRWEEESKSIKEIIALTDGFSSKEKESIAIALLAGWDKYALPIDEDEECNWPHQGRKLRMLVERLGFDKLSNFTDQYDLNYSTFHYAYHGIRFGTDLLMNFYELFGFSFDYLLNDVGTMFISNKNDGEAVFSVIDHGLRLPNEARKELATQLLIL